MGFASWLRYCRDIAHRRPTKLCTIFGQLLGWYTMYTLLGALASWRNFAPCKIDFTSNSCGSPILALFVTARHSSSGRQPNIITAEFTTRQTKRQKSRNVVVCHAKIPIYIIVYKINSNQLTSSNASLRTGRDMPQRLCCGKFSTESARLPTTKWSLL